MIANILKTPKGPAVTFEIDGAADFGGLAKGMRAALGDGPGGLSSSGPSRRDDGSLDPRVVYSVSGLDEASVVQIVAAHTGEPLPEPADKLAHLVLRAGKAYAVAVDGSEQAEVSLASAIAPRIE